MNIFYLSNNTRECAQMHNDKHVVKMILEYAQLLCTAHHVLDGDDDPKFRSLTDHTLLYKPTHKNHPSAVWVRKSQINYDWLWFLWVDLCKEYTYRYGKIHATEKKLKNLLIYTPLNIPKAGFTEPTQAMPDEYKNESSIVAYRSYYAKAKAHIAKWKNRDIPNFLQGELT